jgi:hypothetical protein
MVFTSLADMIRAALWGLGIEADPKEVKHWIRKHHYADVDEETLGRELTKVRRGLRGEEDPLGDDPAYIDVDISLREDSKGPRNNSSALLGL